MAKDPTKQETIRVLDRQPMASDLDENIPAIWHYRQGVYLSVKIRNRIHTTEFGSGTPISGGAVITGSAAVAAPPGPGPGGPTSNLLAYMGMFLNG